VERSEAVVQPLTGQHPPAPPDERRHQKARLFQILAGTGLYICNVLMLIALAWLGVIDGIHVLVYAVAGTLICGFFIGMIVSRSATCACGIRAWRRR
jgi:hypothetical protein